MGGLPAPGPLRAAVRPVHLREGLVDALTAELAESGCTAEQTFGCSLDQLDRAAVHLVGAEVAGELVGVCMERPPRER